MCCSCSLPGDSFHYFLQFWEISSLNHTDKLEKNYEAPLEDFQKNPRVRKIFVRNFGAGNGCVNFMDAWKNALFLQEKPMSIKFLVLEGGVLGFGGGGSADLIFMGAGIFLRLSGLNNKNEKLGGPGRPL